MVVKVAVVDTGIRAELSPDVAARIAMRLAEDGRVQCVDGEAIDPVGHGSAVASLILARVGRCSLLSAQVFFAAKPTAARVIAAAIDWGVAEGARVVNLSLGLREDRRELRESCCAAIARGVLLVASHPARGATTYPAVYPGVLAVTGDIRCGEGDCSSIAEDRLFGACPTPPHGFSGGGASYAAARMAGQAGAYFERNPSATARDFRTHLHAISRFHGREHKQLVI